MKAIVNNMRHKLLQKNPNYESNPIFEKLTAISKNLLYIEMLKKNGEEQESKIEIRNTLYAFSQIVEDYTKLMKQ